MILFDSQNFLPDVGGTQLYVTGLADALAARGRRIAVYCDATSAARPVDEARAYPIIRFSGPRPWLRWRKARAVMARIAAGGVSAIVTDTWKSLAPLSPRALCGVRVMCLAHGNEFLQKPGSLKERRMIASLARADIVAANSAFTAGLIAPHAGVKTDVRVIWPGVIAPKGASRVFAPRGIGTPPRLLTIARLEPRKGIDMVLRAMPALKAIHPGLIYDIVGKGADRNRLMQLARDLGVGDCVRFHLYVSDEDKAAFLADADIFVLANRREAHSVEGFGIVFQEAAAFGLPAIAGADGGTADAVLDGKTGLIVDGEDGGAIRDAVLLVLANDNLRHAMAAAAHARFWADFAWDAAVARFEAALA